MMKLKRTIFILIFVFFLFVLISCDSGNNNDYKIAFSEKEIDLYLNEETELEFSYNFDASKYNIVLTAIDEDVLAVDDTIVTGLKLGSTVVKVEVNIDGIILEDEMTVNVINKGPKVYNLVVDGTTYQVQAGNIIASFLETVFSGYTYEVRDGMVFDGWFEDEARTIKYDVRQYIGSDTKIYSKYHETTDKLGFPMTIDTILNYKYEYKDNYDLGNVFTVSPAYYGDLSLYDLSGYTLYSVRYDIKKEVNKIIGIINKDRIDISDDYYDGFVVGLKKDYSEYDTYYEKMKAGVTINLNTYSVNTARRIYFDRQMDEDNVHELSSVPLSSGFASLYDMTYHKELYNKNGASKCYPASTTKIITAMAALKYAKMEDTHVIGDEYDLTFEAPGPSTAGVVKGQTWTLRELLYALMLPSGNDAAYCVAALTVDVHEPGNTYTAREKADRFADYMNEVAKEAGAIGSHFMVPDGNGYYKKDGSWDDRLTYHYVTANDMVSIAKYAFNFGGVAEVVSTSYKQVKLANGQTYNFSNGNALIQRTSDYYYQGAVGMKTGYTGEAMICLVSGVEIDGRFVIAATMFAYSSAARYNDTHLLYNLAFKSN